MCFRVGVMVGIVVMVCAPAAVAAERFASPSGAGTSCTRSVPCSLRQAVTKTAPNDEVIVAAGTYSIASSPILAPDGAENVHIHGDFGGPMPHIDAAVEEEPLGFEDTGGRLSYLEIVNEGPSAFAASCILEGVVNRVRLLARGPGAIGLFQGPGCTVDNSLLRAEGEGALGLRTTDSETSEMIEAAARNVTAIATGPNSIGIRVDYMAVGSISSLTLMLRNAIASGSLYDISASGLGHNGRIVASYSNFDAVGRILPWGEIAYGDGNQSAAPLFADAAAGDYREAAGSPTIDGGVVEAVGDVDLAGGPRILGRAPDIGAFEFSPTPPPPPPPPLVGKITSLRVKPRNFKPVEPGLSRAQRKSRGTNVVYRLSARGRVRFTVEERTVGRVVKGRCLWETRFNRYGKPCTLFLPVKGKFGRQGHAGANHFKFSGRLRGEALEPGDYKLVGSAGGAKRAARFTITK
jgi:hypothetical protein